MRKRSPSILTILAFLVTACGGSGDSTQPAGAPGPSPPPAQGVSLPAALTCNLSNFQQDLMERVNQARANARMCGGTSFPAAPPLAWNSKLFDAAAAHAQDMATYNYFSHEGRDGRTFSERVTAAGYAWRAVGENIAAGQTSVEQVMNGWLQSPGHCANIMSNSYTEIGVACVQNDASTYQRYWAMELGQPH